MNDVGAVGFPALSKGMQTNNNYKTDDGFGNATDFGPFVRQEGRHPIASRGRPTADKRAKSSHISFDSDTTLSFFGLPASVTARSRDLWQISDWVKSITRQLGRSY